MRGGDGLPRLHAPTDWIFRRSTLALKAEDTARQHEPSELPGPSLRFTEGDHAVVRLRDRMDVETSIYWQDTKVLVVYFVIAVLCIIASVYLVSLLIFYGTHAAQPQPGAPPPQLVLWDPKLFLHVALAGPAADEATALEGAATATEHPQSMKDQVRADAAGGTTR